MAITPDCGAVIAITPDCEAVIAITPDCEAGYNNTRITELVITTTQA